MDWEQVLVGHGLLRRCGRGDMGVEVRWLHMVFFFFSSRRRHTRSDRDWSSDVCSSDLEGAGRGSRRWSRLSAGQQRRSREGEEHDGTAECNSETGRACHARGSAGAEKWPKSLLIGKKKIGRASCRERV